MKPIRTLVLVAGEESARFLMNEGVGKGVSEIAALAATQFADTNTRDVERPERAGGGPHGANRHGLEPRHDSDELRRARFSAHVIAALEQEWQQARPDRLIIAAPPKMLGALRADLPAVLAAALVADLAKDLIKIPAPDLVGHFSGIIAM